MHDSCESKKNSQAKAVSKLQIYLNKKSFPERKLWFSLGCLVYVDYEYPLNFYKKSAVASALFKPNI